MAVNIICGDAAEVLRNMPSESVNCCVTSPPYYGLRDYGADGQIGLEETPEEYIDRLVEVFREVRRALRDDGTLWLNIGDSYAGSGKGRYKDGIARNAGKKQETSAGTVDGVLQKTTAASGCKPKDLIGIPWMLAFALRADGWYLRQDIIWAKTNPMPESVRDRCTKSHEYIFLLSKSPKYYYDAEAIKEDADGKYKDRYKYSFNDGEKIHGAGRPSGVTSNTAGLRTFSGKRNKRSVWIVPTKGYKGAHFATFPEKLVEPCVLAGCPVGGVVLDPFMGSGTTGVVSIKHGRKFIGIDLNESYCKMAGRRLNEQH